MSTGLMNTACSASRPKRAQRPEVTPPDPRRRTSCTSRRLRSSCYGRVHGQMEKCIITFEVNGERSEVSFVPHRTLLEVIREDLGLTGTKHGCELGECGACTILVDGVPILSCLALAVEAEGKSLTTIEGLASGPRLDPLQSCFAELGATQCGYCTPGILLVAKSLLARTARPTRAEISDALSGNLCRCTGYLQIVEAVEAAIERMNRPLEGP
jgi:aerobic-type carbon monoxide dehydrogenase small subunit (CoxS/CutS family)